MIFQKSELVGAQETSGDSGERNVEGDDIAALKTLVESRFAHSVCHEEPSVGLVVVGNDGAAERLQELYEILSNVATADDADGFAREFATDQRFPLAVLEKVRGLAR